ncbi:MAG: hypothetical protein IT464_02795 [Planctomycetes bacterium]|nr:hypothetical protein [Planctomycetota bacterium]
MNDWAENDNATGNDASETGGSVSEPEPDSAAKQVTPPQPADTDVPVTGTVAPDEGDVALPDAATEPDDLHVRFIRIVVTDIETGDVLKSTRFQYAFFEPTEVMGPSTRVTSKDLSSEFVTDEGGIATIKAPIVRYVVVKCADEDWVIVGGDEPPTVLAVIAGGLIVVRWTQQEADFKIYCKSAAAVSVRCSFSDGLPVAGAISYTLWEAEPQRNQKHRSLWSVNDLPLDPRGRFEIQGVPYPSFIQVVVAASRLGWATTMSVRQLVDASTREINIVLPEEERRGATLRISFSDVPDDVTLRVRVLDQYSFPQADFRQTGNGIWLSKPISLPRTVRVYVEGELAWTSGEIELTDDVVNDVDARPARPAVVRLRVVDEQNLPVVPAIAQRYARQTVSWEDPQRYSKPVSKGTFATADAAGVIRFEDLAPGNQALVVQAKGFEAKQVSYFAKPGETLDLGSITLRRYAGDEGKLRVRISGEGDFNGLVCGVMAYGNGIAFKAVQVPSSGELVFADLHYGKYVVYARGVLVKGSLWQQAFELTPDAPSAEVKLDISKPPTKTPPGD